MNKGNYKNIMLRFQLGINENSKKKYKGKKEHAKHNLNCRSYFLLFSVSSGDLGAGEDISTSLKKFIALKKLFQ